MRLVSSEEHPDRLWESTIRWVSGTLILGVKRPPHEAKHSSTTSAKVKNK
jgi:hypothetical protein